MKQELTAVCLPFSHPVCLFEDLVCLTQSVFLKMFDLEPPLSLLAFAIKDYPLDLWFRDR